MNTSVALPLALIYGGVLALGLGLIVAAIISLLRSFTPGSQSQPSEGAPRRLGRATLYSLGLGGAVLGGVGLLATLLFRLTPLASALWAVGLGVVVGLLAEALLVFLPNRRRVEEMAGAIDADGRQARVVIAIPANGLGEVAYDDGAEIVHLGARSLAGQAIAAGDRVRIERVANRVAIVRPDGPTGNGR